MSLPPDLSPFLLEPMLKPKVWGGTALQRLYGYQARSGECIGEAWLADARSVVEAGEAGHQTLADLVAASPREMLGDAWRPDLPAQFPLLAKFLDAESELSVQVHPPDSYARAHEGVPYGKAEAWYIIEARPGASVFHGTSHTVTPEELVRALQAGRVRDVLAELPVQPGDVIINPPGTIHALGGGVVLYEIQQSSDITYRLYDWDRSASGAGKRELHVRQGMEVAHLDPIAKHKVEPVTVEEAGVTRTILCVSQYFCAELLRLLPDASSVMRLDRFHVLTQLRGNCVLASADGAGQRRLAPGNTAVVPAAMQCYRLKALDTEATLLRAYVPDLERDVVRPLLGCGVSREAIVQLGGDPRTSDLNRILPGKDSPE